MPIDASVAMELKQHLRGRRYGYLFETEKRHTVASIECAGGQASTRLAEAEARRTRHGDARFSARPDFSPCLFRASRQVIRDWCGHSSDKMVDHYTKMLRQHYAPEMAKVKPLLDPSWTPIGPPLVERRVAR